MVSHFLGASTPMMIGILGPTSNQSKTRLNVRTFKGKDKCIMN